MKIKNKHYFLIAGEASGDLHGAELMNELKKINDSIVFSIFNKFNEFEENKSLSLSIFKIEDNNVNFHLSNSNAHIASGSDNKRWVYSHTLN